MIFLSQKLFEIVQNASSKAKFFLFTGCCRSKLHGSWKLSVNAISWASRNFSPWAETILLKDRLLGAQFLKPPVKAIFICTQSKFSNSQLTPIFRTFQEAQCLLWSGYWYLGRLRIASREKLKIIESVKTFWSEYFHCRNLRSPEFFFGIRSTIFRIFNSTYFDSRRPV